MCFVAYAFTYVKLLSMTVEHSQGVGVRSASSSHGWDFGCFGIVHANWLGGLQDVTKTAKGKTCDSNSSPYASAKDGSHTASKLQPILKSKRRRTKQPHLLQSTLLKLLVLA